MGSGPHAFVDHAWTTAQGRRAENQDRAFTDERWLVVSDGIGGHAGGALAAATTIDAVARSLGVELGVEIEPDAARARASAAERATEAVRQANAAVRQGRDADPAVADMGATVVLAVAERIGAEGSTWQVVAVGDSPAWLVTRAGARQVTADDNVAGELLRAGTITAEAADHHPGRHLLLRAVGLEPDVAASATTVQLGPGDVLVLASDGLSAVLGVEQLHRTLASSTSMAEAVEALVQQALDAGTTDNVTVAAVRHRS